MKLLRCLGAVLLLGSALLGCEQPRSAVPGAADKPAARVVAQDASKDTTTQISRQGNVSVTTSTDTARLGRLLNVRRLHPRRVQYRYTFIDNAGGLVPGPSDYRLEAVLWFDSLTFRHLRGFYKSTDYPSPHLRQEQFDFPWLPPAVRTELRASRPDYAGDPDFVFDSQGGEVWFLRDKLLLRAASN